MNKLEEARMKQASKKFKRSAMLLTPAEERRLRQPLTSILIDVRLPVAMQLAFEAGWKARAKKTKP